MAATTPSGSRRITEVMPLEIVTAGLGGQCSASAGEVAHRVKAAGQLVVTHSADRFSRVDSFHGQHLLKVRFHRIGDLEQCLGALGGSGGRPGLLSGTGRGHRRVDVLGR